MGNKTHLAFLSRKTFDTGPRAQSQLLKGKTDLLRIVMKDGESQGPSYLIRLRRVTARWGMRWFPISDPLTERAPTTVHRPDASVRISKLLGRLEKGGPGLGLRMASGTNRLSDLAEKSLCLLPASGTGCAAGVH